MTQPLATSSQFLSISFQSSFVFLTIRARAARQEVDEADEVGRGRVLVNLSVHETG